MAKEDLKIVVLGGVLVVAQAFAFKEPAVAPPGDNVSAPVNVGGILQEKAGTFIAAVLSSRGSAWFAVDSGNVGIGTVSPAAKLEVQGNIKIVDGTQGANRVLTSDADGLASWKPTHGLFGACTLTSDDSDTYCGGPGAGGSPISPATCYEDPTGYDPVKCVCEPGYLLTITGKAPSQAGIGYIGAQYHSCLQQ